MKYLLLLLVVAFGVWMLTTKSRIARRRAAPPNADAPPSTKAQTGAAPQAMLSCAHCGVHLPQSDALTEGQRAYCSDAHRRLGPGPRA